MKRNLSLLAVLLVPPLAAEGQVTYCRDIGDNKTYCSGGTVIHRFDKMTVIPNVAPAQPYPPAMPPNPLLQNHILVLFHPPILYLQPVPLPAGAWFFGSALAFLGWYRRGGQSRTET